jgi:hypothetical protein
VHAYLHRKEGDLSNAGYWYARGGKAPATTSLEQEWLAITRSLLAKARAKAESSAATRRFAAA